VVALLIYAYARGNRTSRQIERCCRADVAYRVLRAQLTPDHSTIAEFRRRHEAEIAELFDDVLGLCREAGLVSVGVITIDTTKIKANTSMGQNRSYREVVTEILRQATRPIAARMSSTGISAAMSCPSSCAVRRIGR
jgi:transposase